MKDGEKVLLTVIGLSAIIVPLLLWIFSNLLTNNKHP